MGRLRRITAIVSAVCVLLLVGLCMSQEAHAEAVEARSLPEPFLAKVLRQYSDLTSVTSSSSMEDRSQPKIEERSLLQAQVHQDPGLLLDMGTCDDPAGDSSLAEDLAALTVGYDPTTGDYSFVIEFHDPFIGLITEDQIGVPIDSDQNAGTGFSWGALGMGSDYGIIIKGSESGCSAELFKTPSSAGPEWTSLAPIEAVLDEAENTIRLEFPGAYIGSPQAFNTFVCSTWEGLGYSAYDFLPDGGYHVYARTVVASEKITPTPLHFIDVSASHAYSVSIEELASRGIVNGYPEGTFQPDASVTCQQFAKMIVRTLDLPVSETDVCPFVDVPSNVSEIDPLYPDKYVAVCAQEGITVGKTETTFGPYDNITRARLITMVSRALDLADPPMDYVPPFNAYDATHYTFSRKAAYAGLLDGLQGIGPGFDFYESATRGEVCVVLYSVLR